MKHLSLATFGKKINENSIEANLGILIALIARKKNIS